MDVKILENASVSGAAAAEHAAELIGAAIAQNDKARIVLSTGASQFAFFEAFVQADLDWSKVEMFHLDEYVGLADSHKASFRKYLKERFVSLVPLGKVHYVNGEGDTKLEIAQLTEEIRKSPIDVALIGIGENSHIAFNDPPADFDTKEAYMVVTLDEACRKQQVGEGWFPSVQDVPSQAITMTVHQILQSKAILSVVPHRVKAEAVKKTLESPISNLVPSTILRTHSNWTLYLDKESSSLHRG